MSGMSGSFGNRGILGGKLLPVAARIIGVIQAQIAGAVAIAGDVEVVQPNHDDLNANANIQVDDADVAVGNPVFVTSVPGAANAVVELGLQELIGYNDVIAQFQYSDSFATALAATPISGTLVQFSFYTDEIGTGAILTPTGKLFIFDADPSLSAGDTDMASIAVWGTVIGKIHISSADWTADANGAMACIVDQPIVFHPLTDIYFAWFHEDATPFNAVGGDDERMRFNIWLERRS